MSRKLIKHQSNNKNKPITKGCYIKANGDGTTSNDENNFGRVQTIGFVVWVKWVKESELCLRNSSTR